MKNRTTDSKLPSEDVAKPKRRQTIIDIYNSTSTGHQVGSGVSKPSSYRKSRTAKLQQQFRCHNSPPISLITSLKTGPTVDDKEGKGSGTLPTPAAPPNPPAAHVPLTPVINPAVAASSVHTLSGSSPAAPLTCSAQTSPKSAPKRIFTNCTIYVNGTTAPLISDIMLKRILCSQGACIATGLARKAVTHVIIGKPNAGAGEGGAGGGLAAGKLQKELSKNRKPVKFVSVNWVLDSLKSGKRLPESQYAMLSLHSEKQKNILSFVKTQDSAVKP